MKAPFESFLDSVQMQMQVVADAKGRIEWLKADPGSATARGVRSPAPTLLSALVGASPPAFNQPPSGTDRGRNLKLRSILGLTAAKLERLPRCTS